MACFTIVEIDAHSWQIEEEQVRCFLFSGTKRALLVDSGMEHKDLRRIVTGLTQLPVLLVNTHTDHDHISCNHQFSPAYMSPSEYSFYRQVQGNAEPVQPLWDGDIIDLGGRRFKVISTPGHTPGSIALLDEEKRILVGGDGIQDGTIYMFGTQRDLTAYIHSLEKLCTSYEDRFDLVYPSHSHCPVKAEIIPALITGAKRILAGEIQGESFSPDEPGVLCYDIHVARILCAAGDLD